MTTADLEEFTTAYIECALWAEMDNADDSGGAPLDDNYGPEDIDAKSMQQIQEDCRSFVEANADDLAGLDAERCGHDFWLTRQGHGAGFWDRGLGAVGDRLTAASKVYGSDGIVVGDDGKLHFS